MFKILNAMKQEEIFTRERGRTQENCLPTFGFPLNFHTKILNFHTMRESYA